MKIFINITKNILQPRTFSTIQCDGSFENGFGRTAVLFRHYTKVTPRMRMESSTEAEWKAILDALHVGLEHNETHIGIENDNLGIVNTFLNDIIPKRDYARYYKWKITEDAKETEWTGLRWISRKQNFADKLFMKH